jgi:hypothetical protein
MHFIPMLSFLLEQKIDSMCNVLAVAMPLDSQQETCIYAVCFRNS